MKKMFDAMMFADDTMTVGLVEQRLPRLAARTSSTRRADSLNAALFATPPWSQCGLLCALHLGGSRPSRSFTERAPKRAPPSLSPDAANEPH
jgi:hypothetical protein